MDTLAESMSTFWADCVQGGSVNNTISTSTSQACAIDRITRRLACWGNQGLRDGTAPLVPVLQVAISNSQGCAITVANESLLCWRWHDFHVPDNPEDLGVVAQVAMSVMYTCIITKQTRALKCWWGREQELEGSSAGPVAQVAMGVFHSCATRLFDYSVFCWRNGYLVTTPPPTTDKAMSAPSGLKAFEVSVGWWHNCAIIASLDRSVVCWGENSRNQTAVPADLGQVAQVVVGVQHTCAVALVSRQLTCWGDNMLGQLDIPDGLGPVEEVAAGDYHTCALLALARPSHLLCWGNGWGKGRVLNFDIKGGGGIGGGRGEVDRRSLNLLLQISSVAAVITLVMFWLLTALLLGIIKRRRPRVRTATDHDEVPLLPEGLMVEDKEEGEDDEDEACPAEDVLGKKATTGTSTAGVPQYWTTGRRPQRHHELIYVDDAVHVQVFQDLLDGTYRPVATQDRPCPRWSRRERQHPVGPRGSGDSSSCSGSGGVASGDVGCVRRPGGCDCVQPGATPGLPAQFRLRRVVRVEDSLRWAVYARRRDALQLAATCSSSSSSSANGSRPCRVSELMPPVMTSSFLEWQRATAGAAGQRQLLGELDEASGEVYLFHGTSCRNALRIAREHFRAPHSSSSNGSSGALLSHSRGGILSGSRGSKSGMYGPGFYFTESSTKADEHSLDDCEEQVFAMLLCRVGLGQFIYYTTEKDQRAVYRLQSSSAGGVSAAMDAKYHSIIGDRAKAAGTFREFVLCDAGHIYPEYILFYERVPRTNLDVAAPSPPMHLAGSRPTRPFVPEVPIYWVNYHRDPWRDAFKCHYVLRKHLPGLLRMAQEASSATDQWSSLVLLRARRLECSESWVEFLAFKQQLRVLEEAGLPAGARTPSAGGAAQRASGRDASFALQRVMTALHPEGATGAGEGGAAVEVFSSEAHLEADLNEVFLWHGTSKEAAECIMEEGRFQLPQEAASASRAVARMVGNEGKIGSLVPSSTLLGKKTAEEAEAEPLAGAAEEEGCLEEHQQARKVRHGQRFGPGAYFSDDLSKSLRYAEPDADGVRHVLLCRVVCGRVLYTEEERGRPRPPPRGAAAVETTKKMKEKGFDCFVANPKGQGPREFIAQDPRQIYPEYILEWRAFS